MENINKGGIMGETKLSDLKARAYDLIRGLESTRAELQRISNLIVQLEQKGEKE